MINRKKDMLITGGLIMKKKIIRGVCLANGTMVPAWPKEKPKEKSTTLEELGTEADRD
jgi:hypothetical protein